MTLLSGLVDQPEQMGAFEMFISKSEPTEQMLAKVAAILARKKSAARRDSLEFDRWLESIGPTK